MDCGSLGALQDVVLVVVGAEGQKHGVFVAVSHPNYNAAVGNDAYEEKEIYFLLINDLTP